MTTREEPDLFGGIVVVAAEGTMATSEGWEGDLYLPTPAGERAVTWTAIPYYLVANREPEEMVVWVPED